MNFCILAALLGVGTCYPNAPQQRDAMAVQIEPPAIYAMWWHEMENCTGLRRDIRSVRWFVVTDTTRQDGMFPCHVGRCAGEYAPPDRVFLAAPWVLSAGLVRHETVHALGIMDHPFPTYPTCAPRVIPPPTVTVCEP